MNKGKKSFHLLLRKAFFTGALFCVLGILNGCQKEQETSETKQPVRPVKLLTIGGVSATKTQKMPGTVRASDRVDLAFQVSGPLIQLPVREGQPIKKGDLIARIDPRDYETNLRNAMGTLGKAKAKLQYDIAEYQRYVNVKKNEPGAVSDSMVSLKYAAENVARADLQSAQAAVEAAKDQLAYTYLRAPFDGVIAKKYVDNYQEVQAKEAIVSVQNNTNIEVLVDVPELIVAPIRKVQPHVSAEFASAPGQSFDLTVKEFATQADAQTQTYRVVFVMPAPAGVRILPGMTATVVFDLSVAALADSEISIPAIALFADNGGKPGVWVIDNKTMQVQRRAVTSGVLSGSDNIRISSGLKVGDTIAISGVSMLREGQIVRAFE
jgi:membrane fusion protein, multidrug efflux system